MIDLIKYTDCSNNYMLMRFRGVSHFNNVIDLVRLEIVSICLNKLELCIKMVLIIKYLYLFN